MNKLFNNRSFAIILTSLMFFSMSGFSVEVAFAETTEEYTAENVVEEEKSDGDIVTDEENSDDVALTGTGEEGTVEDLSGNEGESETPEETTTKITRRIAATGWVGAPVALTLNGSALNLRTLIGQAPSKYSVVQGSCTDGTYAYYLMIDSSNNKGLVAKVNMADNSLAGQSAVLPIVHGNGMTYDSKRNLLVISEKNDAKQRLTIVDAGSLQLVAQQTVRYDHYLNDTSYFKDNQRDKGLAAIAYCEEYDCYIALQREYKNLIIFSPYNGSEDNSLQAIALIKTKISDAYPATYQGMDADGQYAYILLSPGTGQSNNIILVMEWNSESNEDEIKSVIGDPNKAGYIDHYMGCTGVTTPKEPSATIGISMPYESESIYHTTDAEGNENFYLAAYHSHNVYKWGKVKQAYKVKYKKVWKKVKWKKVKKKYKKNGKKYYKYVWKYKRKKVWTYKTKYKWVDGWVYDYFGREDYVYNLGVLMKPRAEASTESVTE